MAQAISSATQKIINIIDDIFASIDTLQYELASAKSNCTVSDEEAKYYKSSKYTGYNKLNINIPNDLVNTIIKNGDSSKPWERQQIHDVVTMFNKMKRQEQLRLMGPCALEECQ